MRVIVTGSRTWTDRSIIARRLAQLPPGTVVVHGDCRIGADAIARSVVAQWMPGISDEPHAAEKFGRWPSCGPIRNSHMAKLGADLCIAFRMPGKSNGTDDMIKKARAKRIPTEVIGPAPDR